MHAIVKKIVKYSQPYILDAVRDSYGPNTAIRVLS